MTKYSFFYAKRYVEQVMMFPFVLLGKMIAHFKPLKQEYDLFFFFPTYSIGGAERVNAEIVKSFPDKKSIIFFTKKSPNNGMKHFFQNVGADLHDISAYTDNKWLYWNSFIYRGICSYYINHQKKRPSVFIGQCNFGYKLTPHLNPNINVSDLIHMFHDGFFWVWAPFVKFLNHRVVVGDVFVKKFRDGFVKNGVPLKYMERYKVVFYKLEYLPQTYHQRAYTNTLKVYYAGRGGFQKRLWILVKIIQKCIQQKLPIEFSLAGPHKDELPQEIIDLGIYKGELTGGEVMYDFHKKNDVLLMVSGLEGFPIVIMEAMALGSVPVVTNIDAIPEHIQSGENGILLEQVFDEEKLIDEAIEQLMSLQKDKIKLQTLSQNAYRYAIQNFSEKKFIEGYRSVILNEPF